MKIVAVKKPFSCSVCEKGYSSEELAIKCQSKPNRGSFAEGDIVLGLGEDQSHVVSKILWEDAGAYHTQRLFFNGTTPRNGHTSRFFRKVKFLNGDKLEVIINTDNGNVSFNGYGIVKGYNVEKTGRVMVILDWFMPDSMNPDNYILEKSLNMMPMDYCHKIN